MNIKSNEHLEGFKLHQAIALDFAENLTKAVENASPTKKIKMLSEASESAERYFKIYRDAVIGELQIIEEQRDRLENQLY